MPAPPSPHQVTSVNGKRGDVVLDASAIGGVSASDLPAKVTGVRVGRGDAKNDRAATANDFPNIPTSKVTTGVFDPERLGSGATGLGGNILYDNGTWGPAAGGGGGLGDPGANGPIKRTAVNTTAPAVAADIVGLFSGTPTGSLFLRDDGTLAAGGGGGGLADPGSNGLLKRTALNVTAIAALSDLLTTIGNQNANTVLAGPTAGGAGPMTVRTLVAADIPSIANLTGLIAQASHGLSVGNIVRLSGTSYVKAKADSAANAEVVGIVAVVVDANNFFILTNGTVTGLSGLTAGTTYFLDPTTAGALTATEPTTPTQVTKPLLVALSTTAGYFMNMRGLVLNATANQSANTFLAGPTSGGAAAPVFRSNVAEDVATGTATSRKLPFSAGTGVRPAWDSILVSDLPPDSGGGTFATLTGVQGFSNSAYYTILDATHPTIYTMVALVMNPSVASVTVAYRTDSGLSASYSSNLGISATSLWEHKIFDTGTGGVKQTASGQFWSSRWGLVAGMAQNGGTVDVSGNGYAVTGVSVTTLWTGGDRWAIGRGNSGYSAWAGAIAWVGMWTSILTPTQIAAMRNAGPLAGARWLLDFRTGSVAFSSNAGLSLTTTGSGFQNVTV